MIYADAIKEYWNIILKRYWSISYLEKKYAGVRKITINEEIRNLTYCFENQARIFKSGKRAWFCDKLTEYFGTKATEIFMSGYFFQYYK